ncbi:MAG: lysylphosphatidylglycerol synthase transmembrane domain-containing protein [Bacteroidaceae bacterium]|nr:lysylphosphatidylglycerol synthase transmembrane domain-containing protein [Bacteroidaceae bacterium]
MKHLVQIILSLTIAVGVMYFVYRDFPFSSVSHTLLYETKWQWVAVAMLSGSLAQAIRGVRWQILLVPIGERCMWRNLVGSIFMSFAASLVIPRIGEVSRCATLRKTDGVSFTHSLGTVVAERIADTLVLLLLIAIVFITQWQQVVSFFPSTTDVNGQADSTSWSPLSVAAIAVGVGLILIVAAARLYRRNKLFRSKCDKFKEGFLSVAQCGRIFLFILYTCLICLFNLLNLWLMFYAFDSTSQLGCQAALLAFCMIAFAMVVPTPNGAGPWHYVVSTSLIIYGVSKDNAASFALIVHALHVLTIILLGFVGMMIVKKNKSSQTLPIVGR